jgi:hypothetical protein
MDAGPSSVAPITGFVRASTGTLRPTEENIASVPENVPAPIKVNSNSGAPSGDDRDAEFTDRPAAKRARLGLGFGGADDDADALGDTPGLGFGSAAMDTAAEHAARPSSDGVAAGAAAAADAAASAAPLDDKAETVAEVWVNTEADANAAEDPAKDSGSRKLMTYGDGF